MINYLVLGFIIGVFWGQFGGKWVGEVIGEWVLNKWGSWYSMSDGEKLKASTCMLVLTVLVASLMTGFLVYVVPRLIG